MPKMMDVVLINGWKQTAEQPLKRWAGPHGWSAQEIIKGDHLRLGIVVYDERGKVVGTVKTPMELFTL